MAGLTQGFQAGFNMADRLAREEESKRRFGLREERLGRQEERQQQAAERQQQLFESQMEQSQYQKSRRPIIEQREEQQFQTTQKAKQAQIENLNLQMKKAKKEMQMKDITNAYGIAWQEFNDTGTISPETYDNLKQASADTAFDPSAIMDKDYLSSLDFLNNTAQFGFKDVDPNQLMTSFNKVFKPDIDKVMVADGSAYNRVTNAKIDKDGNVTFELTAYDNQGQPIDNRWYGNIIPYSKLVDSAFARKAAAASLVSNPQFMAQMEYMHSQNPTKYGKQGQTLMMNNIKFAQSYYNSALDDLEKNRREILRKYQSNSLMDEKEKQKAINEEMKVVQDSFNQKIVALSSQFSPQELRQARIPMMGLGGGGSSIGGQGGGVNDANQTQGTATFDDDIKKFLASKGLQAQ